MLHLPQNNHAWDKPLINYCFIVWLIILGQCGDSASQSMKNSPRSYEPCCYSSESQRHLLFISTKWKQPNAPNIPLPKSRTNTNASFSAHLSSQPLKCVTNSQTVLIHGKRYKNWVFFVSSNMPMLCCKAALRMFRFFWHCLAKHFLKIKFISFLGEKEKEKHWH